MSGSITNRPVENGFIFERGIERVDYQNDIATPRLPQGQRDLPPARVAMRSHLQQLLTQENWQSALLTHLDEGQIDPNLLLPGAYRKTVKELREHLRRLANKATSPAARRALREAEEVLDEEVELHVLLANYRGSLHKG